MRFTDRNGIVWTDILICSSQCGFRSDDLNLMTCPNDGRVLSETSVDARQRLGRIASPYYCEASQCPGHPFVDDNC